MNTNTAKKKQLVQQSGPLRFYEKVTGTWVTGIYTLKDETGFPISMSMEVAKDKGYKIDWVETLACAGVQGIEKYDALIEELELIIPLEVEDVKFLFAAGFMRFKGTFQEACLKLQEHINRT